MANYEESIVKLTNNQLKKLESTGKNKTKTKIRIKKKNFHDEELLHQLFLRTRQKTRLRNAFANSMSTDIKFILQLSKIIQFNQEFFPSLCWINFLVR